MSKSLNVMGKLKDRDFMLEMPKWRGVEIAEETIVNWIHESIEYLEENPNEWFTYTTSGDSMVFVMREDSTVCPYHVTVCKVMCRGDVCTNNQGVD